MRLLFFLLLAANVALFAWYEWLRTPPAAVTGAALLPSTPPLKLISELTPAERRALVEPAAPASAVPPVSTGSASAPVPALACASYGPLPSAAAAQTALQRLQKLGLTAQERVMPGKVQFGYWVYLPPFGSRREAEAAAKMLKRRGVKDLYVVTDAADRNAISLGVFSQRGGALERLANIRKLGLHPALAERFRDAPRYWLEARGAQSALPETGALADLQENGQPIQRGPCGEPGAPAH